MTSLQNISSGTRDLFAVDEYRIDGRDKVSGRSTYAADVKRDGALWAAFVESPYPHAAVLAIDTRAARAIAGVRAVLTAEDIGHRRFGRALCDWPILASGTVRFIGDRVAAVAAETRAAAEEAARAIVVTYDELRGVFDAASALRPGAPELHPDYNAYDYIMPHDERGLRAHPNVYGSRTTRKGDAALDAIFAQAPHVFEHAFETPRQLAGFIEPRATLVWIDGDVVHLHSPNKGPFAFRRHFAHVAGIPEEKVIVEPVAIGGDFGGKGLTLDELPCYFLARATGRPVRYTATYAEELRAVRRGTVPRYGCVRRSPPTARSSRTSRPSSSTAARTRQRSPSRRSCRATATARYPIACRTLVSTASASTRTLFPGRTFAARPKSRRSLRGKGTSIASRGLSRSIRSSFRLRNVIRDGDSTLLGETINHPMAYEVLQTLGRTAAPAARANGIGRGIAMVCAHTGSGKTAVRMRSFADGRVEAVIGAVDQGVGLATVVRRVVAAALGIDPERVAVHRGSTGDALPDQGSGHSRVTHVVGRAALDAAEQLHAAVAAGEEAEVVGRFISDHGEQVPGDLTFGAYAIDLHVDRETGEIDVRDALFVMDTGQIINPVAHQGQIDGGFIMGLGAALMEDVTLNEDGKVTVPSLGEYKLPTMRDIPPLRTVLLPAAPGDGPFGTRMIGELSNVGVPAAVVNAVDDAIGVRFGHFPVRAEDVFSALAGRTS